MPERFTSKRKALSEQGCLYIGPALAANNDRPLTGFFAVRVLGVSANRSVPDGGHFAYMDLNAAPRRKIMVGVRPPRLVIHSRTWSG